MAGEYHFTIEQGATLHFDITWTIDGTPVNLTGYTARLQARQRRDSPDPVISLIEGAGLTLGGIAGTIAVDMTDEETAALDFDRADYDLELESGGGIVKRLLEGRVSLARESTRAEAS